MSSLLHVDDTRLLVDASRPAIATGARGGLKQLVPRLAAIFFFAVDIAFAAGAFMLAYLGRFSADDALPSLGYESYVRLAALEGLLTGILLATHGLYNLERPQSWPVRLRAIASSSAMALVLAVTVTYFLGDQAFSRLWLASGWFGSILVLTVWRTLAHRIYERARDSLSPANRVLIVGANRVGQEIAAEMQRTREVVGFVDNGSDVAHLDPPLLGPIAQLDELVQACAVDELIVALPANRREQLSRLLARGFRREVQIKLLPDLAELLPERVEFHELAGRKYIGFVPTAAVSWAKRALDLMLVSVGLLLLAPLFLMIALAIKVDSAGPVFYRQQRLGKNGRAFWMLKFRSMCQDADRRLESLRLHNEATGPLFKMRQDPRVTRVGRLLRRWSLDELPQLMNVIRGEMSLVGPRPPLPSEVEQYEEWELGRLRALPGLTGLWQVSGRSEVPFHDMVRLDLHYIRNWSMAMDLEILLRTIPAVLTNRGAF